MTKELEKNQPNEQSIPFYAAVLEAYINGHGVTLEEAAKEFKRQILANPKDTANPDHLAELDQAVQYLLRVKS